MSHNSALHILLLLLLVHIFCGIQIISSCQSVTYSDPDDRTLTLMNFSHVLYTHPSIYAFFLHEFVLHVVNTPPYLHRLFMRGFHLQSLILCISIIEIALYKNNSLTATYKELIHSYQ